MNTELMEIVNLVKTTQDPKSVYMQLTAYRDLLQLNALNTEQQIIDNTMNLQKAIRLSDPKNSVLEPEDIQVWLASVQIYSREKPVLIRKLTRESRILNIVESSILRLETECCLTQEKIIEEETSKLDEALSTIIRHLGHSE